ncbi:MAG: glucosaminidase domain-containing protein [Alistipes sp.]|nr:glucosaminidase domain-containing protein [Candidatus Alistipes equi]
MERYGIPASITIAQGILESDSGNSELSRQSNNHFGIKCHKGWEGEKVYHDDDALGECFRSYPSVEASYQDHSEFLDSRPRYDFLFAFSSEDYKSWAYGLKKAGYATAPDYAERLIKLIERYKLFLLDKGIKYEKIVQDETRRSEIAPRTERGAISEKGIDPDYYRVSINTYKGYSIFKSNGVPYILAHKGDTWASVADTFFIAQGTLKRFNDAKDKTLNEGDIVFIEKKKKCWEGNIMYHTALEAESWHSISQSYGISEKNLKKLNKALSRKKVAKGDKIVLRKARKE